MIFGAFVGVDYTTKKPFYIGVDWKSATDSLISALSECNKLGSFDIDSLKQGFVDLTNNKITIVNATRAAKIAFKSGQILMQQPELDPSVINLSGYRNFIDRFMKGHINDW